VVVAIAIAADATSPYANQETHFRVRLFYLPLEQTLNKHWQCL